VIAIWGVDLLAALAGDRLPRSEAIGVDARVVAFTFAVSLATGLLFGLLPALRATRPAAATVLRDGGRTSTEGRERYGLRGTIAVGETALAMVLLIGAGLMLRSFWRMIDVDPGFRAENVVSLSVSLNGDELGGVEGMARLRERILTRLEQVPNVIAVGGSKTLPLHGGGEPYGFTLPERPETSIRPDAGAFLVAGRYFEALGIALRNGRTFTRADTVRPVIVISESMARQFWPGEDPVGRSVGFTRSATAEIIGVVADVRTQGLTEEPGPAVYIPMRWAPRSTLKLFVRTRGNPLAMTAAIREAIREVDPNQPIAELGTLDRVVSSTVAQPRLVATLLGVFGALALALAVVGIYGVIAFNVAQRTQEIGLRMALGADQGSVVRMVVGRTARLSVTGVVIGTLGALALTRLLESQLYGVEPADPPTFVAVAAVLSVSALVAGYIPARRAAGVDPMTALRD
jgi:putative ABC transport system permease protein